LPNPDERKYSYVYTYLCANPDARPGHVLGRLTVSRIQIVGDCDAWRKKRLLAYLGVLGHIAVAMYFHSMADSASIIDNCVAPNRDVVADLALLAHDNMVTGQQT
jgi:hypothetical protein